MTSEKHISIVIPNYNNASTIGKCLKATFSSRYKNFEVIVVDDHSGDDSVEVIKGFPCKLITLDKRAGTSKARNTGALNSIGDIIFFTDADCLLNEDTLLIINRTISSVDKGVIIGGTYSKMPYDRGFFNQFQAVFVNYFETKNPQNPDYIAAHAMVINREVFKTSGGFPEKFMPIIEDVEFTHRLQRHGCKLIMNPDIEVRHIFNFTLYRSIRNAIKKTMYWSMYSLKNRDALKDSGTASKELKMNVTAAFSCAALFIGWLFFREIFFLYLLSLLFIFNISINKGLFKAFYEAGGVSFAMLASLYYIIFYSFSVGIGAISGATKYFFKRGRIY